jgi:MFS family permease
MMAEPKGQGRSWLLVAVLTLAIAISYVDRYALAMLAEPIKRDIGLSDTGLGVLTGFAFSAFYGVFGLAMARLSDRGHGRLVVIGSLLVWSVMTALSGLAQNFWQMLLLRFGVGAGEAGVAPSAHAMLARSFPPHRRNLPLAVFSAGSPLGILAALFLTGHLDAMLGWRWTFVVLGLPGLVVGLFVVAARRLFPPTVVPQAGPAAGGLGAAIRGLVGNPRFVNLCLLMAGLVFLLFGQAQWLPAYFERSHGIGRADLGVSLALTQGIGMLVGMVGGGLLSDWLVQRRRMARIYMVIATLALGGPAAAMVFFVDDAATAFLLVAIAGTCTSLPGGALWAMIQDVLPDDLRATGSAFSSLLGWLIGLGLGPVVIGFLSDQLTPALGQGALRHALLVTVAAVAALLLLPLWRLYRLEPDDQALAA